MQKNIDVVNRCCEQRLNGVKMLRLKPGFITALKGAGVFAFLLSSLVTVSSLSGCEKVANSAKNIQSDWVGLKRNVEIYSCMTGKLIKKYRGDVRINPEDANDMSLLVDGKRVHTNLCYIISEIGTKEEAIDKPNFNHE